MENANKGTPGVNKQYAQVHGNRGAQLNFNNPSKSTKSGGSAKGGGKKGK